MDYEGSKIYDIHVDHQLFGLTKLDITVSGYNYSYLVSSVRLKAH